MKQKIFSAIVAVAVSVLLFSTVLASQLGVVTVIPDTSPNFTHTVGLPPSSTGRGGHSYKYTLFVSGQSASVWGKWASSGPQTVKTNYSWRVWIPRNGGFLDAGVNYFVRNTDEAFFITVNQENHADVWVWLGLAWGTGNPALSYTRLFNGCVNGFACDTQHDVWWDDAKYVPLP